VKLYQGVSFIARSLGAGRALHGKKRHPTIEDGVCIYAGTTIMGGDTVIGANSTIGANVFLTKSVPPNSLVYYEEKDVAIVQKRKKSDRTTYDESRMNTRGSGRETATAPASLKVRKGRNSTKNR
jgi:serine O-acetyltransferase